MNKLYTYVMQHDAGLAPNPFWGFCTLAVCTPNHQGSRTQRGDWIVGVSDKRRGYKLIHVMEVDERVHMNDYFRDERFAAKKPVKDGPPSGGAATTSTASTHSDAGCSTRTVLTKAR